MRTYLLQSGTAKPLYEQLYRALRRDIEQGLLAAGEKLPSKRKLAAHLKVSVVTVEGAYAQLVAEGYLVAKPKSGYFVAPDGLAALPQPFPALPGQTERPSDTGGGAEPVAALLDFRTNRVDTDHFPFYTWAKLMREVLAEKSSALLKATDPQGIRPLREEIARFLSNYRGIAADPEQIVVGAGSEYLTGLIIQLLGRGSGYGVEDPGYPKLRQILSANGARPIPLPMDHSGLCPHSLAQAEVGAVHVTPSHHFPLGVVMPVGRRLALLRWAEERGRYLIEDDYDSEFRFSGRPIPALKSLDASGSVVYLNTFTKSIAPSLRIGFMVLPPRLLARYRRELRFYSSTVPSFEQYALAKFMASGQFERHIARMRTLYKGRRDALISALNTHCPTGGIELHGKEAGLHMLMRVHNGMDEAQLVAAAAEQGVGVSGLSTYYINRSRCPGSTVVVGYAGLDTVELQRAAQCLYRAWFSPRGTTK